MTNVIAYGIIPSSLSNSTQCPITNSFAISEGVDPSIVSCSNAALYSSALVYEFNSACIN